jgi:hypothetical protein
MRDSDGATEGLAEKGRAPIGIGETYRSWGYGQGSGFRVTSESGVLSWLC